MEGCLVDSIEVYAETLRLIDLPMTIDMSNSITFVSIGCACNSEWTPENDQQYPIFIRNFKKYHDDININIILIDPTIEKIPSLLNGGMESVGFARFKKHVKRKNIVESYDVCYRNVYACKNNIKLFIFNKAVVYAPKLMTFDVGPIILPSDERNVWDFHQHRQQEKCGKIDITTILDRLNQKCIKEDGLLIVHDFSGMDIWILDKYFSNYTDVYSDKIVYDLSDGTQRGCFLDMSDEKNHVYFEVKNSRVTMDNVKKVSPHVINFVLQDCQKYPVPVISKIKRLKEKLITDFMVYLNNYRKALLWKIGYDTNYDVDIKKRSIYKTDLTILDLMHNTALVDLHENNNILEFIRVLKDLFEMKKSEVESVYGIKIELPIDDPNSWAKEMDRTLYFLQNKVN